MTYPKDKRFSVHRRFYDHCSCSGRLSLDVKNIVATALLQCKESMGKFESALAMLQMGTPALGDSHDADSLFALLQSMPICALGDSLAHAGFKKEAFACFRACEQLKTEFD